MKPGMKMLAMAKTQGGSMGGYNREMNDQPEMRRRRDDRGRYMEEPESPRMTTRGEDNYRKRPEPHMPPYLEDRKRMEKEPERMRDNNVVNIRDYQDRRQIGFSSNDDERRAEGYDNRGFETARMHGGTMQKQQMRMGGAKGMGDEGLTREQAEKWVECMEDKDGVKGGTYTWHQAQQYGRNLGITGQERLVEFYAAMNAMQSDFWPAAKKFGVDKPEFYAMLAKCFIEDPDAVEDKTRMYYECIVQK